MILYKHHCSAVFGIAYDLTDGQSAVKLKSNEHALVSAGYGTKYPQTPINCVILAHYFAVLKQSDRYETNKSAPMPFGKFFL
jgi:hypothetical protein